MGKAVATSSAGCGDGAMATRVAQEVAVAHLRVCVVVVVVRLRVWCSSRCARACVYLCSGLQAACTKDFTELFACGNSCCALACVVVVLAVRLRACGSNRCACSRVGQ